MTSPIIKVAVVQAAPVLFDTPATIERLVRLADEAAAGGAALVVFPEAYIGGYPKGLDFGARLGTRTPEGREDFRRYFESAIDIPGPEVVALAEVAKRHGIHLVVGVIERDGGTLYCTALTFDPNGRILARHRKLMPTALERLVWGFGDGSTLGVAESTIGRIGSVICWENYMPLLRTAMYAQGVEFYCAPTVDDRDTWLPTMRTIALEGRCFVLSACQFLTQADYPSEYHATISENPVLIRGGSCIIDPLGNILAEPVFGEQVILFAELDRRAIARGKYDLDVVGHYARPDIFRLHVDTQPQTPVTFDNPSSSGLSIGRLEHPKGDGQSCSD
ncbi:carbon-nitrogen hydrolase family protein [Sphingobium xenophagum]|uniref:carbon-nitrogen hydrolase family protein n=1 Tax=Sphingobium xenophagum TaxID=121428 RepID=UPI00035D8251|nr:carbon-nitrogen hydrolase family protein [Sphingobium xenophagum]